VQQNDETLGGTRSKILAQLRTVVLEVLTILVGILRALGVDAWYSGVQDRELGSEYQVRIARELRGARSFLEGADREAARALDYAEVASGFFNRGVLPDDADAFVVALYNMGRDSSQGFDRSTFEDLVVTASKARYAS
jgi:hypothetical protein